MCAQAVWRTGLEDLRKVQQRLDTGDLLHAAGTERVWATLHVLRSLVNEVRCCLRHGYRGPAAV